MSLKPWRLLNTFCWRSLWGLRRLPVSCWFWFFRVLTCREHQTPLLFGRSLQFGPQPTLFPSCSFFFPPRYLLSWLFPRVTLWEPSRVPLFPSPCPTGLTSVLLPSVSTAKCDALIFFVSFCFDTDFVVLFWIFFFPFLLRVCPEKKSCACFLLFLHTSVYIPLTSLFSIVCARTDRFKRVSKKLF